MGNIIVGEEFRTLAGPIIYKGARLLVIAGQAAFLQGDPDRRGRAVREHVIDQVGRQSVGLLEEGAGPDAVETVQALLRSHPDQAVRVHGDIVDETVGQTDLLGLGHMRQQQQEGKKGKQSTHIGETITQIYQFLFLFPKYGRLQSFFKNIRAVFKFICRIFVGNRNI